jgi:hypothetical protein
MRRHDWSKTLEAAALYCYLKTVEVPEDASSSLYTPHSALAHAAQIFGLSEEEVRKYDDFQAASPRSAAAVALAGILNRNLHLAADKV